MIGVCSHVTAAHWILLVERNLRAHTATSPAHNTNSLIGVDLSPRHITQWCLCVGSVASGYRGAATQRKLIKCGNIGDNRADSPTPTLRGKADPHQRTKTVL